MPESVSVYAGDAVPIYAGKEEYMDNQPTYRVKSGYVVREIAGEFIAIPVSMQDEPQARIAVLSPGGKFLWDLLAEERTLDDLIEAMTQTYDVTAEIAGQDIEEFLTHLSKNQLLESKMEEKQ